MANGAATVIHIRVHPELSGGPGLWIAGSGWAGLALFG
ncbi:hypothetical protein SAMN05444404_3233 [Ruegeria lacuscaerulensis ITI-1157]|nr:hypothetical protein SAMN05444404_3233 [Ruegeria lacuscaerulensis ITI-1157]